MPSSATTAQPHTLVGHDCGEGGEVLEVVVTADVDGADVEVSTVDEDVVAAIVVDVATEVVDTAEVVDEVVLLTTVDDVDDVVTDVDEAGVVVVVVSSANAAPAIPATAMRTAQRPARMRRNRIRSMNVIMPIPDPSLHLRETEDRFPTIRRGSPC